MSKEETNLQHMGNIKSQHSSDETVYIFHLTVVQLQKLIKDAVQQQIDPVIHHLQKLADGKENELLKIEDARKILKVSKKTIHNWIKEKKLRCNWLGGKLYFRMKDIMDSLHSNC